VIDGIVLDIDEDIDLQRKKWWSCKSAKVKDWGEFKESASK
jgi:hypothetical protein